MANPHKRWSKFPRHFNNIDEKDAITTDTYLSIIETYKDFGLDEMYVRHMYINGKAKITSFTIDGQGKLKTVGVWRDPGGHAIWDPELIRLINRPKRKRKRKVKQPANKPQKLKIQKIEKVIKAPVKKPKAIPCKEHEKYTGKRSPRTKCKKCWKYYHTLHPERKQKKGSA